MAKRKKSQKSKSTAKRKKKKLALGSLKKHTFETTPFAVHGETGPGTLATKCPTNTITACQPCVTCICP